MNNTFNVKEHWETDGLYNTIVLHMIIYIKAHVYTVVRIKKPLNIYFHGTSPKKVFINLYMS